MFQNSKVGDKVGISTNLQSKPYNIHIVTDVYPAHISVGLSCDATALFYKGTGAYVSPTKTDRHIVPEAKAILENQIAQQDITQEYLSSLSYRFEQQLDIVKAKFYKGEPTIHRLEDLINQLKTIK